ncbi:hypothetical protein KAFR_0B00450 [Kazachstania africana CBS 2517]|uniref:WD repeat-containing protein JIP5 n=1 Tax=Kazachstania africana (strain ATCC 22294 / BCRC 22015 / CBS 2517 / CECT 1963 / NBRC 1671 / NRRL Y-8276) TaxID=1071382 RepID=H2APP5_KAZAF|nr:hypothetical protein KAFR_0B00450 [Kazachstania africana CBS 2517]CCF56345.1 hypothetical protein KAFR_0B00450 [Kazachstania africana CBS 2517]
MAKKNSKGAQQEEVSDALPLLEFRFDDPLFQMASHPELPIITMGFSNGYVYCYEYDAKSLAKLIETNHIAKKQDKTDEQTTFWKVVNVPEAIDDDDHLKLLWKTRRHKGSVRCMGIDHTGKFLFTIGTDNILKKADIMTGKVVKKSHIVHPQTKAEPKFAKMCLSSTHPLLLLGDESGNVFTVDSNSFELVNLISKIHGGDQINDIFHFDKRSAYKFISAGQTTLAYWDARVDNSNDVNETDELKKKVMLSDDQEDEVLCGAFVDPEVGDTIVCGMGEGILTIWKPEKNDLEDQLSRIKVSKDESIDCIIPTLQDDNCIWCGCSNGKLYKVDVKKSKIIEVRNHSSEDEVQFIDLDCEYRVISGGMDKVKIWNLTNEDDEEESIGDISDDDKSDPEEFSQDSGSDTDESSDMEDSDNSDGEEELVGLSKEELLAELDKDLVSEEEKEDEEQNGKKRAAKDDRKQTKKKKQQKTGLNNSHGIMKFEGL